MTDSTMRILSCMSKYDSCDDIWWRTDGEYWPITFFVGCNDLFYWACADAVSIRDLDLLEKTYDEAAKHCEFGECYAAELFCCRSRKMRPQKPYYKEIPKEMWSLFNNCGPERED